MPSSHSQISPAVEGKNWRIIPRICELSSTIKTFIGIHKIEL